LARYTNKHPEYTIVYLKVFDGDYLHNIRPLRVIGHGNVGSSSDVIVLI